MYRINLIGDIGKDLEVNYSLLESELNKANGDDLEIIINTLGGEVDEAFKIYDGLNAYKNDNKAVVTTITDENCASAGVILLLAGNRRIVNNNTKPFIHNAYVEVVGNSKELKLIADHLETYDYKIAELYAKETSLTILDALELMSLDIELTPDECRQLRFATELSKVYNKVPTFRMIVNNKLNNNQMSKEQKFFELVKNFFQKEDKEEIKVQNKIELTSADVEVNFTELDEDATPGVGDKAQIDGKPAEGDYKMKNGKEYEFKNGILEEIKEEIEEEVIEVVEDKVNENETQLQDALNSIENFKTEKESLLSEIQNLKSQLEDANTKIEVFNKLESEFTQNKKEQRQSKEVETESKIDFASIGKSLNKKTK